MPEKAWKRAERKIANVIGGERIKAHGDRSADVRSDWAVGEVKYRKLLPEWIKNAVRKAQDEATAAQIPLAFLVEANTGKTLVIIDVEDFDLWFAADRKASG